MSGVVRSTRTVEEVTYTVTRRAAEKAIRRWLEDEHRAATTDATTVEFRGDRVIVTTPFEQRSGGVS